MSTLPYFTVALSGPMASGKTTAGHFFASQGVTVIDTDDLVRHYTQPDHPLWPQLKPLIPKHCLQGDQLDRPTWRHHLLTHPALFNQWEKQLHTTVKQDLLTRCQAQPTHYYLLIIPVIDSRHCSFDYHRLCWLTCDQHRREQRLRNRADYHPDHWLLFEKNTLLTQPPADDVMDNNGNNGQLIAACQAQHQTYLHLASEFKSC